MPLNLSSSCFIFASAGSGKTKLLVDRYIKSLLYGIHPREILCLTFTNMAVDEMQMRISAILKQFYLQPTNETKLYIVSQLKINNPSDRLLHQAKNLFIHFQNELNQLKITTIHGFCQLLLQQYPIESNIFSNFQILNADDNQHLIQQVIKQYFTSNNSNIINYFSASNCYDLIQEIFTNEEKYYSILHTPIDLLKYRQLLMEKFNTKTEINFTPAQQQEINEYFPNVNIEDVCLTKTNQIRKNLKHDNLDLNTIADIVYQKKINQLKQEIIDKTISILEIAQNITIELNKIKIQKLTFTDILYKTYYLLTNSYAKDYVLSNTMKGIKTILIDEAQDLSLIQWKILCLLIEQCYLDKINNKTVFIVGDIKQSIYRFQNARYELLLQMYNYSKLILKRINKPFTTTYLDTSYRTYPNILHNIDLIFQDFSNCAFGGTYRQHKSIFSHCNTEQNNNDSKNISSDISASNNNTNNENITNDIFKLIEISDYQDIANYIYQNKINNALILIRSKSDFSINLYYELIKLGMSVAPLDKILLRETTVIQTIISLANLQNEYNLVSALQSKYVFAEPLGKQDIFSLCYKRTCSVLENLQRLFPQYYEKIQQIIIHRQFLIDFFYYLVDEIIMPQQETDRTILNMFLNLVTQYYENNELTDIDSFIEFFKTSTIAISNNNSVSNTLRFSSIHSAKGLEADTVILLDFKLSADKNKLRFLYEDNLNLLDCKIQTNLQNRDDALNVSNKYIHSFKNSNLPLFCVKPSNENGFHEINEIINSEYKEEENELIRLLYVALTRPKKRIYIFGKSSDEYTAFNLIRKKLSLGLFRDLNINI